MTGGSGRYNSFMHRTLLLALSTAELAWAVGMFLVAVKGARSGKRPRDVPGAIPPLVVVGVLLAGGLLWVAVTS